MPTQKVDIMIDREHIIIYITIQYKHTCNLHCIITMAIIIQSCAVNFISSYYLRTFDYIIAYKGIGRFLEHK